MSRIGKKAIEVPAGVKVSINGRTVNVEGAKGKLSFTFRPEVVVTWAESEKKVNVELAKGYTSANKEANAYWGTTRAIIRNMIDGVTKGYEKSMEVVGVGWVPSMAGKQLKLVVGLANPLMMDIPVGLTVTVDKQFVRISGADKQLVGQFASAMRQLRKPEPYNGKGIKYTTETIRRKQGKQFGA
jgi:large subunit ribosomal protein L6